MQALSVVFLAAWLSSLSQSPVKLPISIEALRDVPVSSDVCCGERRGVLYIGGQSFTIKKGERFQMIKVYSEGECRIRFKRKDYDVSSCPWLDGFGDHQADIFRLQPNTSQIESGRTPTR